MKDEIHGSEGYKKHMESFSKFCIVDAVMVPIVTLKKR